MILYLLIVSLSLNILFNTKKFFLYFICISTSALLAFISSLSGILVIIEDIDLWGLRVLLTVSSTGLLIWAYLYIILIYKREYTKGILLVFSIISFILSVLRFILIVIYGIREIQFINQISLIINSLGSYVCILNIVVLCIISRNFKNDRNINLKDRE